MCARPMRGCLAATARDIVVAAMANRDERPRAHVIEPARSGHSTCQTCGGPICDSELRLSEAFVSDEGQWARGHRNARTARHRDWLDGDDRHHVNDPNPDVWARFHHLACAAQHQPYKLRSALAAFTLELPDREQLERAIERALSAVDVAEDSKATRDEYLGFIARLRDAPDHDLMLVFADWLQSVDDPRGELIIVQHALETAAGAHRRLLVDREKKLLAAHRKHLMPDRIEGTYVWRRGFVQRVVLKNVDHGLARVFAHPSLRLLRELVVETDGQTSIVVAANLPTPLSPTLRVLDLSNMSSIAKRNAGLGAIGPLLANALPRLERLRLAGAADLHDVCHPSLAELELAYIDATSAVQATAGGEPRTLVERIGGLDRRNLPALARLILRVERGLDAAVDALASTNVLAGLQALTLRGDLWPVGLESLRAAGARFEVLDLRGTQFASVDLPRLSPLATRVVLDEPAPASAKQVGEWLVRHTRCPEWGTGRVVKESDDGLEVEFERGGKKHVRNVELLEEVEAND